MEYGNSDNFLHRVEAARHQNLEFHVLHSKPRTQNDRQTLATNEEAVNRR